MRIRTVKHIFLAILLICCCAIGAAGCGNKHSVQPEQPTAETFYSLQTAYSYGWLSKSNLTKISEYNKSTATYPDSLSDAVQSKIKDKTAEILNDGIYGYLKVEAKDITISKYYGTYNGFAIVSVKCSLLRYSDKDKGKDVEIDGITFHYENNGYVKEMSAWRI